MSELKVGSVWKERDKRFERYVRIVALPASGFSHVLIRTCERDGSLPVKGSRKTAADKSAFGRRYEQINQRDGQ